MSGTDYLQTYCPKCGARLGHVEADFTENVVIYRPCGCKASIAPEIRGADRSRMISRCPECGQAHCICDKDFDLTPAQVAAIENQRRPRGREVDRD